jgi:hypothetical protein
MAPALPGAPLKTITGEQLPDGVVLLEMLDSVEHVARGGDPGEPVLPIGGDDPGGFLLGCGSTIPETGSSIPDARARI